MRNIKIRNINNKVCFENTDKTPKAQSPIEPKTDSVNLNKQPEPPKITTLQSVLPFMITNEQIKQINEAKMLPKNVCFVYQDWSHFRGHKYERPFYSITYSSAPLPNKTQILPDGYVVIRDFYGTPEARKILE
jgi:hypothetical protein